jgi:hypothetical protein
MQKLAEKKKTAAATLEAEVEHTPRQTVSKLRPWFKPLLSLQSGTNWCLWQPNYFALSMALCPQ